MTGYSLSPSAGVARQPALAARFAAVAAIGFACVMLLFRFRSFAMHALSAWRYRYGLDYGEGIVWQQALLIPGPRMYGDITQYPYIVFEYPPVYHLVSRLAAWIAGDMLAGGRIVSTVATLATATMIGLIINLATEQKLAGRFRAVGAIIGALIFLTFPHVLFWSALMRVDMLALCLGYAGLVLMLLSPRHPILGYAAMAAFVAAAYTRQSTISAAVASLAVMMFVAPRRAIGLAAFGAALGVGALALLMWLTQGRFLGHVVTDNESRFSVVVALEKIAYHIGLQRYFPVLTCAGLFAGWSLHRRAAAEPPVTSSNLNVGRPRFQILFIYTGLAALVTLTSGKALAGDNYFIEWFSVSSIWIGVFVGWALRLAWRGTALDPRSPLGAMVCLVASLLMVVQLWPRPVPEVPFADATTQRESAELVARVSAAPKPVLSDDMVILLRAGKDVPLEPAIFAELAATGTWDGNIERDMLRHHFFSFLITFRGPGDKFFDERYLPETRDTMRATYAPTETLGDYRIWTPIN